MEKAYEGEVNFIEWLSQVEIRNAFFRDSMQIFQKVSWYYVTKMLCNDLHKLYITYRLYIITVSLKIIVDLRCSFLNCLWLSKVVTKRYDFNNTYL